MIFVIGLKIDFITYSGIADEIKWWLCCCYVNEFIAFLIYKSVSPSPKWDQVIIWFLPT